MAQKHTPGPWRVSRLPKGPRGGGGGLVLSFTPVNFSLFPDTPQMEADLRLAAAAPALLNELKQGLQLLTAIEQETGYCTAETQRQWAQLIAEADCA